MKQITQFFLEGESPTLIEYKLLVIKLLFEFESETLDGGWAWAKVWRKL